MNKILAIVLGLVIAIPMAAKETNPRQTYKIYVDPQGVMRRSDNKQEVSYYGTNYTAPFAYSYRALGYLDKDRKDAIDRDVYHIARMGQNAFRLHLWDVELADSLGNLLQNDHLDLLDYMIAQFEKRGIDIILTAQTNFGNGYPERDINTGAFSYKYGKSGVHTDPDGQKAQERYLDQLAKHVNPYTGLSYAKDNAIIAVEINNEPHHTAGKEEVTAYINKMVKALRKAGFDKPILYNVTHNPEVTEAYYDADINGTTYQWYPTGLVSGHERKGNLLPAFDDYTIPWKDTMPNYNKLARVVYEFDPADVLYSHLYPAVARAFRKEGFQWITQFAYDPLHLAPYNTEYPTHYLNLVYTPAKALSMMIAAETAKETPRGADYGAYPDNTTFGHTRISFEEDLSEFNAPEKFLYSNSTTTQPVDRAALRQVAGHGSSPVVAYEGTGTYFLDAVGNTGAWRLEVFPDVVQVDDPFGNTSLTDAKTVTVAAPRKLTIDLPSLGKEFIYKGVNNGNSADGKATDGSLTVTPGVYLLAPDAKGLAAAEKVDKVAGNIGMAEYVLPDNDPMPFNLLPILDSDPAIDVAQIPEAWTFRFNRKHTNWDEEPTYQLTSTPEKDGVIVLRRYVADKIAKIPADRTPATLNVKFQDHSGDVVADALPAGTELAVVTDKGFTYSAPVTLDDKGVASVRVADLSPRKGWIMPTPYPVTVTRESPASDEPIGDFRQIQFVELIIPQHAGHATTLLPAGIWLK